MGFSIKEEELAGRVGVTLKELNKVTAVLTNDKLIKVWAYGLGWFQVTAH